MAVIIPRHDASAATGTWADYWDTTTWLTEADWRGHMELFLRATEPLLGYCADDVVLDIGCGSGALAACLSGRFAAYHGVDTSRRSIEQCERRFTGAPNVFFHQLRDDYTDLSLLEPERFSLIVCVSVIQYYRSLEEVQRLIQSVRRLARPGARMLIADIPVTSSLWSDGLGTLKAAWRTRRLLWTLGMWFRASRSAYQQYRAQHGLLVMSPETLQAMTRRLGLEAEIVDRPLTVNDHRRHWLIRF